MYLAQLSIQRYIQVPERFIKVHLRNKHLDPLVCTVPQCDYKKPFGKQHELRRHMETLHGGSHTYCCPIELCGETFPRNDKLLIKHMREKYDMLRCLHNHCSATVFKTQEEAHKQLHGEFECGLLSCERAPRSYFRREDLGRHLQKHHDMRYYYTAVSIAWGMNASDSIVRGYHLYNRWAPVQDCSICSKEQEDTYAYAQMG
jgi:hypothetical protein